jgi:hypothetical protein
LAGARFDGGFFINDGFSGTVIFVGFGLAFVDTGCAVFTDWRSFAAAV